MDTSSVEPAKLDKLYEALAAAQSKFPEILKTAEVKVRTKTGGEYKFMYAPLESILKAVMPSLNANGLSIHQFHRDRVLVTRLAHKSGQCVESNFPMPSIPDPQQYGGYLTYMRRYEITIMLGVSAQDDNDANDFEGTQTKSFEKPKQEARPAGVKTSPAQENVIKELLAKLGLKAGIPTDAITASSMLNDLTIKLKAKEKEDAIKLEEAKRLKALQSQARPTPPPRKDFKSASASDASYDQSFTTDEIPF